MNSPTSPPDSQLPESIRTVQMLWKLKAALDRASVEMQVRLGVSGPQRFLVRFIGLAPGITRESLAKGLAVAPADIHADLEHLLAQGLVIAHSASPGYFLTAKGASVNAAMAGTVEDAVARACDEASGYEKMSFRRMLDRIVTRLGGI